MLMFLPLFCLFAYLNGFNLHLSYYQNLIRLLEVMELRVGCLELYLILS
jgi:hypothetical protein